jgi:hypothetical protein
MRLFLRFLGGLAIIAVFFFGTLFAMNYFAPLCPKGKSISFNGPFPKFGNGSAYTASVAELDSFADSAEGGTRSIYMVCEGAYALGPAHTAHAEVAANGKGRFSHWRSIGFVFSSSDNSNPNTNGRHYSAVAP